MDKELRIKKLREIQEIQDPEQEGIPITYRGQKIKFKAYRIPLTFLIYNKYNGRIGSLVKSFEKQNHVLNTEKGGDKKIIEKFLWDSKVDRNQITMDSLVENGQLKVGIVTNDGIIIDGNRRAMLLDKIYAEREKWKKHNVDDCQYFIGIVLPEDADEKEIQRLETTYQMGEDEKLGYNPIEKYLKCKDLKEIGFSPEDIAKMMAEKKSRIEEWLEIMDLMDNYLGYLGYGGIYTRLEKTEGPLVDLNQYLKKYIKGSSQVTWRYTDIDVSELKLLCFDYIRARYEGKEFRDIAQTSKKGSIFCKSKELWTSFLNEHKKNVQSLKEDSVQELREKNPNEELSKLLQARDNDWRIKSQNFIKGNLKKHYARLEDMNESNKPLELVQRALSALGSINQDIDEFYDNPGVFETLKEIMRKSAGFVRLIEKSNKRK